MGGSTAIRALLVHRVRTPSIFAAMRSIIAGNWKMHKDRSEAAALVDAVVARSRDLSPEVELIVAPAYLFLDDAVKRSKGSCLRVSAQNCHEEVKGAITGEVSAPMLKSIGVEHCIVGHSERRQYFGETDQVVGRKIARLLEAGMVPIYCCGEDHEQRRSGKHFDVVAAQLRTALSGFKPDGLGELIIAYEPVWAIGTGLNATAEQAQEMHAFIRAELRRMSATADTTPILYGGSCKPDNAAALFAVEDVNGGLIGGASLEAASFLELARILVAVKHPS